MVNIGTIGIIMVIKNTDGYHLKNCERTPYHNQFINGGIFSFLLLCLFFLFLLPFFLICFLLHELLYIYY